MSVNILSPFLQLSPKSEFPRLLLLSRSSPTPQDLSTLSGFMLTGIGGPSLRYSFLNKSHSSWIPLSKQSFLPASWLSDSGADQAEGMGAVRWHGGWPLIALPLLLSRAVKEEPRDEEEEARMKASSRAARKTPGLPKDVSVAELLRELSLTQEEELLFLQLPDSLPGQPPTQDVKPIKTEVQSEDGQMVVIKQEKDRVCSRLSSVKMQGTRRGKSHL